MYKIVTKMGEIVPFQLSQIQEKVALLSGHDFILKPKQAWVTTAVLAVMAEAMRTKPHFIAYSIAHSLEIQGVLHDRFVQLVESLPSELGPTIVKNREDLVKFSNGSIFQIVTIGGKPPAQGTPINFLHLTEAWAYDKDNPTQDVQVFYNFVRAAVVKNGRIVIETTPGPANSFAHDLYKKCKAGGYMKAHFFEWFWHPEYTKPRKDREWPTYDELMVDPLTEREQALIRKGVDHEQIAWARKEIEENLFGLPGFLMTYPEDDSACWFNPSGSYFNAALLADWLRKDEFPPPIGRFSH